MYQIQYSAHFRRVLYQITNVFLTSVEEIPKNRRITSQEGGKKHFEACPQFSFRMHSKAIFNIINFIRGVEPRYDFDLVGTVEKQIDLVQSHGLPATWLLQYDALIDPKFRSALSQLDDKQEIGMWFEVVQPQVEKAGLKWRGRPGYAWDWHAHVGFSAGYTPSEREALADVAMEEFRSVYGRYPASVGSWFMDAHLLGYLHDKYEVIASCNCKDQWGTDGYTMWGGYFNQAYYPSRKNAFVPAQTAENQIPIPIFRMLGSDPIYQYDASIEGNGQIVITLEPSCEIGGGSPDWVRWFMDTSMNSPSITFGYAQVGQENSFGWDLMHRGLEDQLSVLSEIARKQEARVETLETSGRWYRSTYELTPASAVTALTDWKNENRSSIWYSSRFYRTNLFWEDGKLRIRDVRLFDESYAERYLTEVCPKPPSIYDTLPVLDGILWSDDDTAAGLRLVEILPDGSAQELMGGTPSANESGESLVAEWECCQDARATATCGPDTFALTLSGCKSWALDMRWAESKEIPLKEVSRNTLTFEYEGFPYQICLSSGQFERIDTNAIRLCPDADGNLVISFT